MSQARQGHRKEESDYSKDGQCSGQPERELQRPGIVAWEGSLRGAQPTERARWALLLPTPETVPPKVACNGSAWRVIPGCELRLQTPPPWGSSYLINEKHNVFW